jgi:hypothetical protein
MMAGFCLQHKNIYCTSCLFILYFYKKHVEPCECFTMSTRNSCGPGSSVSIATELRAGWCGDRIPVGARFSAPVRTGSEAHPASCRMGTGSFPGVKYGQGVLLTTHPLLVPWSWKNRAIPLPTLWATWGL